MDNQDLWNPQQDAPVDLPVEGFLLYHVSDEELEDATGAGPETPTSQHSDAGEPDDEEEEEQAAEEPQSEEEQEEQAAEERQSEADSDGEGEEAPQPPNDRPADHDLDEERRSWSCCHLWPVVTITMALIVVVLALGTQWMLLWNKDAADLPPGGSANDEFMHVTSIEWTTVSVHHAATPIPTPTGTVTSIAFSTVFPTATPAAVPT